MNVLPNLTDMFTELKISNLTDEDIEWIKENFATTKNSVIAAKFGVSDATVHRVARHFGLKKTAEFMQQMQRNASLLGAKATLAETGEAKERRAAIARQNSKNKFQTGVWALADKTPEELAEINRKKTATWKAKREEDMIRLGWGYPQRTKFRLPRDFDPVRQRKLLSYRSRMRKMGYYIPDKAGMKVFITPDTRRSARTEKAATKLGFLFKPAPEVSQQVSCSRGCQCAAR